MAPPYCLGHIHRMRICEFDLPSEVIRVANFEKNKVVVAKIVLYAPRFRGDHWFRKRQVFEETRGRIDFSEDVAVVRNNAEVTMLDSLDNLLEIALAKVIDISIESPPLS